MLWLLLSGQIPSAKEKHDFSRELVSRMDVDEETTALVRKFPKNLHPMAKLSAGILLLQKNSKFAKA